MKNNYLKYIYTLVAFVTVIVANAQVVFHETFGTSTTRTTSQYVPQGGNDANLGFSTYTCSSFYKPATEEYTANNKPTCRPDDLGSYNQYVRNISDGYYAVVDPGNKAKSSSPSSLDQLRDWAVTDPAVLGNSGAVLIVNAGELKNQYYRRGVTLKRNTSYKVSFKVLSSSANLPNNSLQFRSKIEIQSVSSEYVLHTSPALTVSAHNVWQQKEYVFKTPNDNSCDTNYAISLRNDNAVNFGNDFYIDDIILEEIIDPNAPVILCDSSTASLSTIINANDDIFVTSKTGGSYNLISNDTYNQGAPGTGFVFSGSGTNASISPIGNWPSGVSINANGQIVIADSVNVPNGTKLSYQICNLLGVCSTATITIKYAIEGYNDTYIWKNPSSIQTYLSVISNDIYNLSGDTPTAINLNPTTGNVTISKKGTWTNGINLDTATGIITVATNTSIPNGSLQLEYTICNKALGVCQDVKVLFLDKYSPIDNWNPGTIKIRNGSQYVCFDGTAIIDNDVMGFGSPESAFANDAFIPRKYSWEISFDGGYNWTQTDALLGSEEPTGDDASESASGSVGSIIVDKGNSISISNVTKDFLIRRKVNVYKYLSPSGRFNSYSNSLFISVAKNNEIIFPNGVNSIAVPLGQNVNLPEITTTYKSAVTYTKVSNTGTVSPTNITLPVGYHEYTVKATTVATGGNANTNISPALGCETTAVIKVIVYDPKDCDVYVKRTFATHSRGWTSGLSGVANPEQAVPDTSTGQVNRANAATLTGGVVLLGIGTVGVDLYFTKSDGTLYSGTELQGKKVVVKFGEQYSGLKVAGGVSVVGLNIPTSTSLTNLPLAPNQSGKTFGIKGGILDALKGDNVFEYSFTPTDRNGGSVPFNGIRIQLGSLIGVADLASVFYAYIEEEGDIVQTGASNKNINQADYCTMLSNNVTVSPPPSLLYPENQRDVDATWVKSEADSPIANTNIKLNTFIEDAFWGNYSEVLNVASGLSSIVFPYYAVDTDYDSYSLFNSTAGVLNRQFLKAKLKQKARPGDQVQITLAYPNINVLNLSLLQLGNFKIVYYLDGAVVGEERLEQFRVLDLGLFRFRDKRRAVLSRPVNFLFDTVELQQFNTVSVNLGDGLHVHDIRINPLRAFSGMTDPKQVTQLCATESLPIQKPDACTGYEISLARVTEYGPAYQNADGTPMLDYNGQPIKSIYAIEDIPNSNLKDLGVDNSGFISYFDLNINKLFVGPNYEGKMLIKIQTKRQGCNYGDAQYLRVDISNCVDGGIVNPVIKSGANY